jgi:hypothetical protein
MERSLSSLKFETENHDISKTHESSKCDICGEEYETPLFAVVSSGYLIAEYYACPRCLSKVSVVEHQKNAEPEEDEEEEEEQTEEAQEVQPELEPEVKEKTEETVVCAHHMGYLKRRPKNTSIPEECFTCSKMIDCMSH